MRFRVRFAAPDGTTFAEDAFAESVGGYTGFSFPDQSDKVGFALIESAVVVNDGREVEVTFNLRPDEEARL